MNLALGSELATTVLTIPALYLRVNSRRQSVVGPSAKEELLLALTLIVSIATGVRPASGDYPPGYICSSLSRRGALNPGTCPSRRWLLPSPSIVCLRFSFCEALRVESGARFDSPYGPSVTSGLRGSRFSTVDTAPMEEGRTEASRTDHQLF